MFADQPILTLPRTAALRVVACLLPLPGALLCAAGAVFELRNTPPDLRLTAVLALLAFGLAILAVWLFRREATRLTLLYANGIEQRTGGTSREMLWTDVEEVWFQAMKMQAGGLLGLAVTAAVDRARKGKDVPLNAS